MGWVATALNPKEGVNPADVTAVGLTSVALAVSLLAWARGSTRHRPANTADGDVNRRLRSGDSGGAGSASELAVPRQLPAAVAGFAGRVAELATLTSLLGQSAGVGGTVVISAVDGAAGIGKTALAVYWAHRVADQFPDGQLYVSLRGFDPAGPPMAPAEAVRGFRQRCGATPTNDRPRP